MDIDVQHELDGFVRRTNEYIQKYLELRKWQPWYAWRPVHLNSGKWAWRRVICRRVRERGKITFRRGKLIHKRWEYEEPFIVILTKE